MPSCWLPIVVLLVLQEVQSVQPIRIEQFLKEPKRIKVVTPEYPDRPRKAGFFGVVVLEATVGEEGRVAAVRVLRGIPLLNEPATAAVKQWR